MMGERNADWRPRDMMNVCNYCTRINIVRFMFLSSRINIIASTLFALQAVRLGY